MHIITIHKSRGYYHMSLICCSIWPDIEQTYVASDFFSKEDARYYLASINTDYSHLRIATYENSDIKQIKHIYYDILRYAIYEASNKNLCCNFCGQILLSKKDESEAVNMLRLGGAYVLLDWWQDKLLTV